MVAAVALDLTGGIAVLGATGSIGTQTLDVIRTCLPHVRVRMLTAFSAIEKLDMLAQEFSPDVVCTGDDDIAAVVANCGASVVVNALSGRAGLAPTLAAINAGMHIALANKESLVTAGALLMAAAREKNVRITPIDSEHSAIWQCLNGRSDLPYEKIILTASGGPFRDWPRARIEREATAARALQHPNWRMGAKITVDSATMMNKGLEYIEALHLFNAAPSQVEMVVHPQSIVHSAVQFADGAVLAQLGTPDMRLPILYALYAPTRVSTPYPRLDFLTMGALTFEAPDEEKFPCLRLAKRAAALGGTAPAVMNAVNEWAVGQFLDGLIGFYDISAIISQALHEYTVQPLTCPDDVWAAESWAREFVCQR